ncbi:DUF2637 domain-containing protein [Streptomyces sp. WAC05374]|uniref:DUF2637 domain-containing protein n=1 Tax=Streptomyces sp. WAC05374 TaxID=2487420 RepID=UPI000F88E353|nr:DUF2637 domain-containing protein [Streptomyces sp. WAC05374]RST18545.1 DUF2637 domain-containing protein [Streptomyces sp. WAC05374]TDF43275.1 DUF2637 domain-containing protein [Streptomyces sp. WAC05374]TDF51061.1 DUF2637 domain-containing protein [Streptomyces sp. WAC05374]TDF52196.1 DUF2637 domain-containing protein [Streptomyces sp. WAC05374]
MNRGGKTLLVLALVAVVGMAFRVSWNALRDVARAVGADSTAATLYPFVVDGLMALALVATLVLTDRADKRFALRVLAAYTIASLVLNYVHGLVPELHGRSVDWGRLADWDPANWLLVLLATSLPVGSIYFGSDLVAKVLHHRPTLLSGMENSDQIAVNQSMPDLVESPPEPPAPVVKLPVMEPVPVDLPLPTDEPAESAPAVAVAAAESARPVRATGRVPDAARSTRPTRTADELLNEARSVTADWPDTDLTAERIRKALRTSAEKARGLRDTLRAERAADCESEAVA